MPGGRNRADAGLAPDTVALEKSTEDGHWYTATANAATVAEGARGVALALAHLERCFGLT